VLDLANCTVTGNTANGVVASYGTTLWVDGCTIGPNTGIGVVAAHASSAAVTDSVVGGNTGGGIVATRSSYVRVGQEPSGTTVLHPVTVTGNGGNGIAITESSAGTVVGTTVENSTSTNLFVGRGSSGQIGIGSNGLTGPVAVQNGSSHGVSVEGGNATIVFTEVSGNALNGIIVTNAGSARVGLLNGNTGVGATTVSNNGQIGLLVSNSGAAFVAATTITGNGTTTGPNGRHGAGVFSGTLILVANNTISANHETGVFVGRNGSVFIGDASFGLGTANTISGNGVTGPNTGGLFAFQGGAIHVVDASISGNQGAAVQAFEDGVVELRGTTAVTVPAGGSTHGATIQFGSKLRVRDTASVISGTGDGIQASNLSAVNIRDASVTVQGNGGGAVGIRCFATAPMTVSAVALTGNLTGVSGTTGAMGGNCNVFQ
jgi:hypothetical protein